MSAPSSPASTLAAVFAPNSILVYGASSDPTRIGGRPLRYLKELGFKGRLYAVNPSRESVQGVPSFKTAAAIPGDIDLAVVVVPADAVSAAIEDCALKGVKGAVVLSSGFAEIGASGARLQADLASLGRKHGIRILGPNCLGYVNGREGISVTFSPSRELRWPGLGTIGFVTQSGAFGSHCAAVSSNRGIGLGMWITTGNESDIDVADCIDYLATDRHVNVIAGYIEGCRDAGKLAIALERARANGKPVILLKAGISDVGAAAVVSHTAALAGRDELFDAFLRQHGVIRASSVDDLLDTAYACSAGIRPDSSRAALVSTSGGVAVMMADAAIAGGLQVEAFSDEVQQKIRSILPFAGTRNPIDTTAQMVNDITVFSKCFQYVLNGSDCDIIVAHLSFIGYDRTLMDNVYEPLRELRRQHPTKLFMLSMLCTSETRIQYEEAGFLVFEDPTRAVQAAAKCRTSAIHLNKPLRATLPETGAALPLFEIGNTNEHQAKAFLARAGIPIPGEVVVHSPQQAADAAEGIGFPVVMKVVSLDIPHKTEAGGVLLNVDSREKATAGYSAILDKVTSYRPGARIEGILVGRQINDGTETIAGILNDPVLGPFVMFGLGGIFAEVLKDVAFRSAPFGLDEAEGMIRELRSFPILDGARGRPKADIKALAATLSRLSRLAAANSGRIDSMDINPLIVRADGVFAVDAMIVAARLGGNPVQV